MNWISVKDELPKQNEKILAYIPSGEPDFDSDIYITCYYSENDEFTPRKFSCYEHFHCYVEADVTHWIKLERPK